MHSEVSIWTHLLIIHVAGGEGFRLYFAVFLLIYFLYQFRSFLITHHVWHHGELEWKRVGYEAAKDAKRTDSQCVYH